MLCCLVELHKSDGMKTTVNISLSANERICMEKNNNNKTTGTTWSKCQVFNEAQDLNWTVLELPVNLVLCTSGFKQQGRVLSCSLHLHPVIYIIYMEQLDRENQSLSKCGFAHYAMNEYGKETVLSTILPAKGEWHAPSLQACSCSCFMPCLGWSSTYSLEVHVPSQLCCLELCKCCWSSCPGSSPEEQRSCTCGCWMQSVGSAALR